MKTPLLNVVPDAVTTVTVGPNSGIIGDMVHDTAAAIGEERCIEEYLEHPITTFLMDGAGEVSFCTGLLPLHEYIFSVAAFSILLLVRRFGSDWLAPFVISSARHSTVRHA